jgi:hypothetical protein
MNYWALNQIPYSWAPKGVILNWSGMDHEDSLHKNPQRDSWTDIDITYNYNPQGFRCPDLNNFLGQKVNIALGCSFTEGVGLPVDGIWPSLIEQELGQPVLNLGLGGGATDSVARILTNIAGLFDIQTVYILWPPAHRLEHYMLIGQDLKLISSRVYHNGEPVEPIGAVRKIETLYPMDSNPEHVWAMTDEMSEQRFNQNRLIVELLAEKFGFNVIQNNINNIASTVRAKELDRLDFARDGQHWGFETHRSIAKLMLDN